MTKWCTGLLWWLAKHPMAHRWTAIFVWNPLVCMSISVGVCWFCVVLCEGGSLLRKIPQLWESVCTRNNWAALPRELFQVWSLIWSIHIPVWPKYPHSSSPSKRKFFCRSLKTKNHGLSGGKIISDKFCSLPMLWLGFNHPHKTKRYVLPRSNSLVLLCCWLGVDVEWNNENSCKVMAIYMLSPWIFPASAWTPNTCHSVDGEEYGHGMGCQCSIVQKTCCGFGLDIHVGVLQSIPLGKQGVRRFVSNKFALEFWIIYLWFGRARSGSGFLAFGQVTTYGD